MSTKASEIHLAEFHVFTQQPHHKPKANPYWWRSRICIDPCKVLDTAKMSPL